MGLLALVISVSSAIAVSKPESKADADAQVPSREYADLLYHAAKAAEQDLHGGYATGKKTY